MNDLFDVCQKRHKGVSTSVEANKTVEKWRARTMILALLQKRTDGLTLDEASAFFDCYPNALSGRFSELAAKGLIVKTDQRRKTRSGATAFVWRIA